MKKYILLLGALLFSFLTQTQAQSALQEKLGDVMLKSETPTSFNYQALLYDAGTPIAAKSVKVKIKLQDEGGRVFFEEEHTTTTAKTGMINISVGKGSTLNGTLNEVVWEKGVFIAAEADSGAGYKSLGPATKIQAVPYALYARAVPVIRGTKAGKEAGLPIFQVQSSKGEPLFSVYEEGISINVPDASDTRRPRGGFAVKSFRLGADLTEANANDRLQIADGAVNVFVDPVMRGYYGGFAVKTRNIMRGDQKVQNTLFNLDNRTTYFTLDCGVQTTFQLRNRCQNNEIVMNMTPDGVIQSKLDEDQVIKKLVEAKPDENLVVAWYWPATGGSDPEKLGFTNLMRWRAPRVRVKTTNVTPPFEVDADYQIEIQNDPTDARKLSDYLKVGYYFQNLGERKLGLMLASKLKLDDDFTFPNGKIVIRTVGVNPIKETEIPFVNQKRLYADKFAKFSATWYVQGGMANYIEFTANEFLMSVQANEFTKNAQVSELLANYPCEIEITSDGYKDCLKATLEAGDIKVTVTDRAAYEKLLGVFASGGETKDYSFDLKLKIANGIWEDEVEGKGNLSVGKY